MWRRPRSCAHRWGALPRRHPGTWSVPAWASSSLRPSTRGWTPPGRIPTVLRERHGAVTAPSRAGGGRLPGGAVLPGAVQLRAQPFPSLQRADPTAPDDLEGLGSVERLGHAQHETTRPPDVLVDVGAFPGQFVGHDHTGLAQRLQDLGSREAVRPYQRDHQVADERLERVDALEPEPA